MIKASLNATPVSRHDVDKNRLIMAHPQLLIGLTIPVRMLRMLRHYGVQPYTNLQLSRLMECCLMNLYG